MLIRERVKHSDFKKLAKEHEHFIWHFLQKEQNESFLGLISYFDEPNDDTKFHQIKFFLENVEIPYFESYTEESMDFLLDFGLNPSFLYVPNKPDRPPVERKRKFSPVLTGFNRYKMVGNSFDLCYCIDYLTELTYKLNPKYIIESKFD